jgi:hypothetical protein
MIEVTITWPLDLSRTMHYVFGTRKKIHVPTLLATIWIQGKRVIFIVETTR